MQSQIRRQLATNMLRLVQDEEPSGEAIPFPRSKQITQPDSRATQLSLPLDHSRDLYVLAMDNLDGHRFVYLLLKLRPRIISDLRHFRRFDLTGIHPERARSAMRESGALYVFHSVPIRALGAERLRSDLSMLCDNTTAAAEKAAAKLAGPLLVLVHTDQHSRLLGPCLAASAEARTGDPWRLVEPDT